MTSVAQRYHLSIDEFLAFCDTDPVRYQRFELVEGEIWPPMPESITHARLVEEVVEALQVRVAALKLTGKVWSHGSVQLDGDGLVLPDVYVVAEGVEPEGEYWNGSQLALAVEIATNTWAKDSGPKLRNYARGRVPACFIVVQDGGEWVAHRHEEPHGESYAHHEVRPVDWMFE